MQDPAAPRTINRDQLREQIRQTIEDATVAQAEAGRVIVAPGAPVGIATTHPPPFWDPGDMPLRVQETAIAFLMTLAVIIIGYPIARAFARRIDRGAPAQRLPAEVTSQLAQLNQAVESIAIEVERISEGQRFTTKLLSEQHRLPAAPRDIS